MDAMIISPDLEGRMRLKQAMAFVPDFKVVKVMSTLSEALQRLFSGESFGSFFISTLFGQDVAREFIRKSRQTEGGRDAAYVFTFSGEARSADVAEDLMQGVDGFLIEPFSVEALQRIYTLAVEVRKQHILARQRSSIRMLSQSAIDGIDEVALSLSVSGERGGARLDRVRETIHKIPEEMHEVYFEVIEEMFTEIQKPRILGYRGPSRRLRERYGSSDKAPRPLWRILRK